MLNDDSGKSLAALLEDGDDEYTFKSLPGSGYAGAGNDCYLYGFKYVAKKYKACKEKVQRRGGSYHCNPELSYMRQVEELIKASFAETEPYLTHKMIEDVLKKKRRFPGIPRGYIGSPAWYKAGSPTGRKDTHDKRGRKKK